MIAMVTAIGCMVRSLQRISVPSAGRLSIPVLRSSILVATRRRGTVPGLLRLHDGSGPDNIAQLFCEKVGPLVSRVDKQQNNDSDLRLGGIIERTNIQNISASACIKSKRCIASRAMLRVDLANIFIEAGLMSNMLATELQDPLSSQCMLQEFVANRTF